MHIPDGYLSAPVAIGTYLLSGAAGAFASKKVKEAVDEQKIPLYGVTAAFVFAAQMVNFPVAGGTSGHLLGGLLASLIAGPYGGFFIMASVLIVQALVFADGGITALGANIFNMAFIGSTLVYFVFRFLIKSTKNETISILLAAWLSVVVSAIACAAELWLSGRSSFLVFPAMAGIHAIIGVGEAVITLGIVQALKTFRPEIFSASTYGGGVSSE